MKEGQLFDKYIERYKVFIETNSKLKGIGPQKSMLAQAKRAVALLEDLTFQKNIISIREKIGIPPSGFINDEKLGAWEMTRFKGLLLLYQTNRKALSWARDLSLDYLETLLFTLQLKPIMDEYKLSTNWVYFLINIVIHSQDDPFAWNFITPDVGVNSLTGDIGFGGSIRREHLEELAKTFDDTDGGGTKKIISSKHNGLVIFNKIKNLSLRKIRTIYPKFKNKLNTLPNINRKNRLPSSKNTLLKNKALEMDELGKGNYYIAEELAGKELAWDIRKEADTVRKILNRAKKE